MKKQLTGFLVVMVVCILYCKKESKDIIRTHHRRPPVSFMPMNESGIRNITLMKIDVDSLRVFSKPYIPQHVKRTADWMLSIIELYDLNDSLLYKSIKTGTELKHLDNDNWLAPIPADTLRMRAWGVYLDMVPDSTTDYNSQKLDIRTTSLFEVVFYHGGRERHPEEIDRL